MSARGFGRASYLAAVSAVAALLLAVAGDARTEEPLLVIEVASAEAERIVLDRAALEALLGHRFSTSTIWTEGVHSYEGPALLDVIRMSGATEGTVRLTALNGYSIALPVAELTDTAPIIATRIDGQPFSVRENGPLWVVYPYDSGPEFQTELVYARSVWQLSGLTLLPD